MDRRIQRYIEAKEQLIALLQEARQAIIQRAVTRGLEPDVPLKPSGVEWLGDVPVHGRCGDYETSSIQTAIRRVTRSDSPAAAAAVAVPPKRSGPTFARWSGSLRDC